MKLGSKRQGIMKKVSTIAVITTIALTTTACDDFLTTMVNISPAMSHAANAVNSGAQAINALNQ